MHIETIKIIDKEFTTNLLVYRKFCVNLYKGNHLFEDLLNESYLSLRDMPVHKLEKHIKECTIEGLIKGVIFYKFKNRFRNNSNLEDKKTINIDQINVTEEPTIEYNFDKTLTSLKIKHPKHYETINEMMEGVRFSENKDRQRLFKAKVKLKQIHGQINN